MKCQDCKHNILEKPQENKRCMKCLYYPRKLVNYFEPIATSKHQISVLYLSNDIEIALIFLYGRSLLISSKSKYFKMAKYENEIQNWETYLKYIIDFDFSESDISDEFSSQDYPKFLTKDTAILIRKMINLFNPIANGIQLTLDSQQKRYRTKVISKKKYNLTISKSKQTRLIASI